VFQRVKYCKMILLKIIYTGEKLNGTRYFYHFCLLFGSRDNAKD